MTVTQAPQSRSRWIDGWNPEDDDFWRRTGRRIAHRNLAFSILAEHVGFSVWSIWSVLVLFMSPEIGLGFTAGEKFVLVTTPALVGSLVRLPYGYAVTRFGGRNWTVFSAAVLLIPTTLAWYFVQQPDTPLWTFMVIGALTGLGGGNFASSMTNIAGFFPQRHQGWALGINAGGGNLGVAVVQLVGLLVIAFAGGAHPSYVAAVYLPLLVIASLGAALWMDNIDAVKVDPSVRAEAVRIPHTWWICLLYVGTFGSFIGYSFAFGLVLQIEFGATPLQAASYTFLGPLLGSVSRPLGGWLSDRRGGARVTAWAFAGLAAATATLVMASTVDSFALFVGTFTVLFVLTGVGNGAVYKMIPATFNRLALERITAGQDASRAFEHARGVAGAVITIAGAVGGLGGVLINLAFRASYLGPAHNADAALLGFTAFYLCCLALSWIVFVRAEDEAGGRVEGASRG